MYHKHPLLLLVIVMCHNLFPSLSENEFILVPRKASFMTNRGAAAQDTITFEATTVYMANLSADSWTLPPVTDLTCVDHCAGNGCAAMCDKMNMLLHYIIALHSRFNQSLMFARQVTDNVLTLGSPGTGDGIAPALLLASSMKTYTASLVDVPERQRRNDHFTNVLKAYQTMYEEAYNQAKRILGTLDSKDEDTFITQYSLAIMMVGQAIDMIVTGLDQYSILVQGCYRSIVESKTVNACVGPNAGFAGRFEGIVYNATIHAVTIMNSAQSTEYVFVSQWDDVYVPFRINDTLCWLDLNVVQIGKNTYYTPQCDGTWCAAPAPINVSDCLISDTISCPHQCSSCHGSVCHTSDNLFTVSAIAGQYFAAAVPKTVRGARVNNTYVEAIAREMKRLYERTDHVVSACNEINVTAQLVTDNTERTIQSVEDINAKLTQIWTAVTDGLSHYSSTYILKWDTFVCFGLGLGTVAFLFTVVIGIVEISQWFMY